MSAYGTGAYGAGAYGQGVAAQGDGKATAAGDMSEPTLAMQGNASGRSSVSGALSIKQALQAAAGGSSSVQGTLAAAVAETGASHGSSSVSGNLTIPIIVGISGESHGTSTAGIAPGHELTITPDQYIAGEQDDDYHGANEDRPPVGSAPGRDRAHFTPHSTGHASSRGNQ